MKRHQKEANQKRNKINKVTVGSAHRRLTSEVYAAKRDRIIMVYSVLAEFERQHNLLYLKQGKENVKEIALQSSGCSDAG